MKPFLPSTYFHILKSSSQQTLSSIRPHVLYPPHVCIPQGSILGLILHTIYTADIPTQPSTILSTFGDNTCILSHQASEYLQNHLQGLELWFRKWRIKINEAKSTHITFTLRKLVCPPVFLNQNPIPTANIVRYLGFYLDKRRTWNPHTRLK